MSLRRRLRLTSAFVCLLSPIAPAWSQTQSQEKPKTPADQAKPAEQPKPAASDQAKPAPDQPKPPQAPKANPFENVPATTPAPAQAPPQQPPAQPGKPQLEAPKPTAPEAPAPAGNVIEAIEFRGARRVPQDTLRSTIGTRKGDVYNEDALHRDFMLLWNTGRFDDIRLETEPG